MKFDDLQNPLHSFALLITHRLFVIHDKLFISTKSEEKMQHDGPQDCQVYQHLFQVMSPQSWLMRATFFVILGQIPCILCIIAQARFLL